MDNYFTSIGLMKELLHREFYAMGTLPLWETFILGDVTLDVTIDMKK